jgi:cytochrome P450
MKTPDMIYRRDYAVLAHSFAYGDVRRTVSKLAKDATKKALGDLDTPVDSCVFDLVEQLVLRVPAEMCESYYGIPITDKIYFGKCTLAVSSFLFGPDFDPADKVSTGQSMALDASKTLRGTIRSAMGGARMLPAAGYDKPIHRLMHLPANFQPMDDDDVHVQLFGMVMGFIPTNVLAAGNILETLLARPEFLATATAAARAGDDERLWRCLRETLRFRNINLGPLRLCEQDVRLAGDGGRSTLIKKGTKILACSQSAMFDGRRIKHPHLFDSARPDEDYLVFGVGQHWCIGAYIAIAQITQMYRVLLRRFDLKPVPGSRGRMKRFNVFPLHMLVELRER